MAVAKGKDCCSVLALSPFHLMLISLYAHKPAQDEMLLAIERAMILTFLTLFPLLQSHIAAADAVLKF